MERLYIVLSEAALELVPEEISGGRDVVSSAKKRGKRPTEILLDISLHYRSMKRLENWHKRGRPDLIHTTLLVASSSELWKRGLVRAIIETRHGLVIVREGTRVVRNYNRFVSLMEQVLLVGRAPPGSDNPLIYVEKRDLFDYIENYVRPDLVYIMHERGRRVRVSEIAERILSSERPVVIVGGFQRGDFSERVLERPYPRVSISDRVLDTWAVVCKILSSIEERAGL